MPKIIPSENSPSLGNFECSHNVLLLHPLQLQNMTCDTEKIDN